MYDLDHSIEIAKIGAAKSGYRVYPGGGGMWCGEHGGYPDATFTDWGLAKATAEILNAVIEGRLVRPAEQPKNYGHFVCGSCGEPVSSDCERCRHLWQT